MINTSINTRIHFRTARCDRHAGQRDPERGPTRGGEDPVRQEAGSPGPAGGESAGALSETQGTAPERPGHGQDHDERAEELLPSPRCPAHSHDCRIPTARGRRRNHCSMIILVLLFLYLKYT